ncbi:MAG: signal recognition particle-docking protein FtsY, partial [Treponema sp.]|nr:signal recognition particle-docking protein FtsY [Treponema sp.]
MKFAEKIKSFFSRGAFLSQDFFDELSDLLVEGDIGPKEAFEAAGLLQEQCKKGKISSPDEARLWLAGLLEEILRGAAVNETQPCAPLPLPEDRPSVILMLGVNGVG